MNVDEVVNAVHQWRHGTLDGKGEAALAAMTTKDDAAVLAQLQVAADARPMDGSSLYEPEFFYGDGDLGRIGYVLGRRELAAAVPVLRRLFSSHPSGEAR
jgi:hypothetical protein